jgi:hypothetical protein
MFIVEGCPKESFKPFLLLYHRGGDHELVTHIQVWKIILKTIVLGNYFKDSTIFTTSSAEFRAAFSKY